MEAFEETQAFVSDLCRAPTLALRLAQLIYAFDNVDPEGGGGIRADRAGRHRAYKIKRFLAAGFTFRPVAASHRVYYSAIMNDKSDKNERISLQS